MILEFGSYRHGHSEITITIAVEPQRNSAQMLWAYKYLWNVNGRLTSQQATDELKAADIQARTQALEAAYVFDGLDATLYFPDGVTICRQLVSANTIGGVRVTRPPAYPKGSGVELVTMRNYTLSLEAIVPLPEALLQSQIESFTEQMAYEPAGGKAIHQETLIGQPVKQTTRVQQVYRATQSGRAVGKYTYPPVPPPIFPNDLVNEYNPPSYDQPRRVGNSLIDWPVRWNYRFESAFPMLSPPHIWGTTYNF